MVLTTRRHRWAMLAATASLMVATLPAGTVTSAGAVESGRAPGEIPVLFVHGYDGNSSKNCNGATFDEALAYFEARGRDRSSLVTVGYYSGDDNCDVDVTDRETDTRTRIKVIASDLANYIYDNYNRQGRSIDIVAHSMGGLITRVAIMGSALSWNGFPSEPLLVDDVVTLGTPHQGVRCDDEPGNGEECRGKEHDTVQWHSMDPDSTFMQVLHSPSHRLDQDWAAPYDWTFVGSKEDGVVSYGSAIDKVRPADHKFGYQGGNEATVTHTGIRELFGGNFNLHYWHAAEDETHSTTNGWAPLEAAYNAVTRNDDW